MVRAIFFDFYSVWLPDKILELLKDATAYGPEVSGDLTMLVDRYYHGTVGVELLANSFRMKLNRPDVDEYTLKLNESNISPAVVDLMRSLHGHFVKLGVLGNLGSMELELLQQFNKKNQLFEVIVCPLSLKTSAPLVSEEVFNKTLQLIGEAPSSCLAVSGHEGYLKFAGTMGMTPIKFEGMGNLSQTLSQVLAKDLPTYVSPE